MADIFTLNIMRFDPSVDNESYVKTYEIPNDDPDFAPMTALKALHYIDRNIEPIGYDYNCRRGTCGRCAMMIDGTASLACYFELTGTHTIEPLAGFPVVRDLVVNKKRVQALFADTGVSVKTFQRDGVLKEIPGDLWREKIYPLNACRECMSCYAGCMALKDNKNGASFIGPGALQQIYSRHIDGEDQSSRLEQAVFSGLFQCVQCGTCSQVCPSRITCTENIKEMMDEAEAQGMKMEVENTTDYWPMI